MTTLTEADVERATLGRLATLGWLAARGADSLAASGMRYRQSRRRGK